MEADRHDVLALALHPTLSALDDPDVLALAAAADRILVTRNGKDVAPLLRSWAEGQRHHAGCILIWSFDHAAFGPILDGIRTILARHPDPRGWRDLVIAL